MDGTIPWLSVASRPVRPYIDAVSDGSALLSGFLVHEVEADLRARVTAPMPLLPPGLDATVEHLWQAAIRRVAEGGAGRLFNGQVFSADRITPHEITGHMTEFRRIVAQMDDPMLGAMLRLRPLAVCGVLRCADGIVIGRRPTGAVYQAGLWQLPPAGSVDRHALRDDGTLDLMGQILTELTEELGLTADQVGRLYPLVAVEHPGSRVTDLGIVLETTLSADAVREAHRAKANTEYDPLMIIAFDRIPDFVDSLGDTLVPPAREFLFRAGLLPYGLSPPSGP